MPKSNQYSAVFYGVGVGPGDPELITLKAARIIHSADVICYLVNDKGTSQSLNIAQNIVDEREDSVTHFPILMPMSRDPSIGDEVYKKAALEISVFLNDGKTVAFLCEGDPLFFGSFTYLLDYLQSEFACEVISGITSPQSASAVLKQPLTILKESYAVISGRHSNEKIRESLMMHDTVVIMKAGMARPRILNILQETGRFNHGKYLEYIGRENQLIEEDLSKLLPEEAGPYFSLFIVTKPDRARA